MKIDRTSKNKYLRKTLCNDKTGIGYLNETKECVITSETKDHYFTVTIPIDKILEIAAFGLRCETKND